MRLIAKSNVEEVEKNAIFRLRVSRSHYEAKLLPPTNMANPSRINRTVDFQNAQGQLLTQPTDSK